MGDSKVRKYKRASSLILLDVETENEPERKGRACLVDISAGGAAFVSNLEFSKGEYVNMRFRFKDEKIIVVEGTIRRIQPRTDAFVYGVKFSGKGMVDKLKIRKLISDIRNT